MSRCGQMCVAALVVAVSLAPATASDAVRKATGEQTLKERLHVLPISDHVWRGALPRPEDFAGLAEEGVTRAIALVSEAQVPAEVRKAAIDAGLTYQFVPVAAADGGDGGGIDRSAVERVVVALKQPGDGVTYLHGGDERDWTAVVEFAYRMKVDGWEYARAMRAVVDRGFVAAGQPGIVADLKRLAAGVDKLPQIEGIPIAEDELHARGEMVSVGAARLNVKTMGTGPALYMVSGGPGESYVPFRPYLDVLSNDFTVVYHDPRGCGLSSKPQYPEAYSIERLARDLEKLRAAQGHERINLLAHSSGGAVAVRYALAHPERVERLVIVSSWAVGSEIMAFAHVREALMSTREQAAKRQLINKLTAEGRFFNDAELSAITRLTMAYDFFGELTPEFRADWARHIDVGAMAYTALRAEYFGGPDDPTGLDLRPVLKQLTGVPTLVIAGEYDLITPPSVVRTFTEHIPGARFELAERSGHYPFVERHAWFVERVRDFLTQKTSSLQGPTR